MANTRSAAKRARQTPVRTAANRRVLTAVKSQTRGIRNAIRAGGKEAAQALASRFTSTVDKAAKTGRIHRNKANRLKSRASRALRTMA